MSAHPYSKREISLIVARLVAHLEVDKWSAHERDILLSYLYSDVHPVNKSPEDNGVKLINATNELLNDCTKWLDELVIEESGQHKCFRTDFLDPQNTVDVESTRASWCAGDKSDTRYVPRMLTPTEAQSMLVYPKAKYKQCVSPKCKAMEFQFENAVLPRLPPISHYFPVEFPLADMCLLCNRRRLSLCQFAHMLTLGHEIDHCIYNLYVENFGPSGYDTSVAGWFVPSVHGKQHANNNECLAVGDSPLYEVKRTADGTVYFDQTQLLHQMPQHLN